MCTSKRNTNRMSQLQCTTSFLQAYWFHSESSQTSTSKNNGLHNKDPIAVHDLVSKTPAFQTHIKHACRVDIPIQRDKDV